MVVAVIHYGAPFESFVENPLAELRVEREQPLAKSRVPRQPFKRSHDIRIEAAPALKGGGRISGKCFIVSLPQR
jgi:hypothetical protein